MELPKPEWEDLWFLPAELADLERILRASISRSGTPDAKVARKVYCERLLKLVKERTVVPHETLER